MEIQESSFTRPGSSRQQIGHEVTDNVSSRRLQYTRRGNSETQSRLPEEEITHSPNTKHSSPSEDQLYPQATASAFTTTYVRRPPVSDFPLSLPPASPPSSPERSSNALPIQLPSFDFLYTIDNPALRKQYISAMLEACSPSELAFVSQTVNMSLIKRDFLKQLPVELAYVILSFVDHPKTLTRISQVSRDWYKLSRDESVWKQMCILHGFDDWEEAREDMEWKLERKRQKLEHLGKGKGKERRTSDDERAKAILARHGDSKISYRRYFKTSWVIRANWRKGGELLDSHKIPIVSPDSGTVTSLALDGEYVVVGFSNAMVKVFSSVSGVLCKTLVGHESGVWAVCLVSKGGTRNDGESIPTNNIKNSKKHTKPGIDTDPPIVDRQDDLPSGYDSDKIRRQKGSKVTVKLKSEGNTSRKKISKSFASNLPAEFLRLNLQAPTDEPGSLAIGEPSKGGTSSIISPSDKGKRREGKGPSRHFIPTITTTSAGSKEPSADQPHFPTGADDTKKIRESKHSGTNHRHRRKSVANCTADRDAYAPIPIKEEREPVRIHLDISSASAGNSDVNNMREHRHSTSHHRHLRKSEAKQTADPDASERTLVFPSDERDSSRLPALDPSATADHSSHRRRRKSESNRPADHDLSDKSKQHRQRTTGHVPRSDGLHVMPDEATHVAIPLHMQSALGIDTGFDSSSGENESSQLSDAAEGQEPRITPAPYRYMSMDEDDAEDLANMGSLERESPFNMTYSTAGWGQPNHIIISGGCDKTVRVWDAASGQCIYVLHGHRNTIRCMRVLKNRPIAITGSRDYDLRVWDIQKGICLRVLSGHLHNVRCMDVAGNKLVSGSYDGTCRLWNIDTGECLHVLQGHLHQIYSVAFDGLRIASGGLDTTVRVWDAETGKCIALLQGHTALVCEVHLSQMMLVTGGSDGRVITFSLDNYQILHRITAHESSVTALQFDKDHLVTGGNDGRVKLYETQTGAFIRELSDPSQSVWKVGFVRGLYAVMCKRGEKMVVEIWSLRPKGKKSLRKDRHK